VSAGQARRIPQLAIPPAWQQVWVCDSPDGHLQATGIDDRGRKQYLYHPRWRELRDGLTFDRLALVGSVLPEIRAAVRAQLRRRTIDQPRLLAGMLHLLDLTGIRIGNETYERDNDSIGLTTLRWTHVTVQGSITTLSFPAKSGQRTEIDVTDRPLARLLLELEDLPRRRVFRAEGRLIRADELNEYLSALAGAHLTAKDFRTWRGTVAALAHLRTYPADRRPTQRSCVAAIDAAAHALNNTRAVARAHYVHPGLIRAFRSGSLAPAPARKRHEFLLAEEADLVSRLPTLGDAAR
jgi:DNA topoisomerase-1